MHIGINGIPNILNAGVYSAMISATVSIARITSNVLNHIFLIKLLIVGVFSAFFKARDISYLKLDTFSGKDSLTGFSTQCGSGIWAKEQISVRLLQQLYLQEKL